RGALISGQRPLDTSIYGFQLGPYLEIPLGQCWSVSLSAGLALVIADGDFTYTETVTMANIPNLAVSRHGDGSHTDFMAGYYGGGRIAYNINDSWSVFAGAQYQDVGLYKHSSNNKQAELDLGGNVFV